MRASQLFFLLPLLIAGPAVAADALLDEGEAIVKANCSRCHAIGPTGESPNPKSPPFRTLSKKYPVQNLEEALAEGIIVGHENEQMPSFQFTPSQVEAIVAYLGSVQVK
ncbi:c-type cytochrome [Methylocystis bryophila]|uniref:Cytochrome C n=1 Tax=Methylocystis bryophila TaxID=655015 RepID=A0A1W6MQJ7_9HYPH|nr:cytochrome c [Methylocystis bryophila]ARN79874.1 cytochrome C [Methylocystis bryophila]BDV39766.1 cytochrome c6 [Methylocystis bryophila]